MSDGPDLERRVLAAVDVVHRDEIARLSILVVTYRELLVANGIAPPPDEALDFALETYRAVRRAAELARGLVDALDEIRSMT